MNLTMDDINNLQIQIDYLMGYSHKLDIVLGMHSSIICFITLMIMFGELDSKLFKFGLSLQYLIYLVYLLVQLYN